MRRSTKVQLGLGIALAAFWAGILVWTLVADPGEPPGYLDDRAFPEAAEPVCAAAMADVDALGDPASVETIEERADLVVRQDERFTAMVVDLRTLPLPDGEQGDWVAEWLDDWDTHIGDRESWADKLHAGEDPPFVETPKGNGNDRVSEAIDNFAEVNDMDSCATLGDV